MPPLVTQGPFMLVVAEHPWPSTSGGRLRAASIANALGDLGPVTVISLDMPAPPAQLAPALERYWARRRSQPLRVKELATGVLRANHVSLQRAIAAELPMAFERLVRELQPSAVLLGRPFFGPFIRAARAYAGCVIVDADESLVRVNRSIVRSAAPLSSRVRALVELLAVGRMEHRDFQHADSLWMSSAIESRSMARRTGAVDIRVVPNIASRPPTANPPGPVRRVGFVGSLRHPPNEEAAFDLIRSIMPAVRAAGGPEELVIIGRDPGARLRSAARAARSVRLTGEVPDTDVVLREAGVLLAPIRSGGGTRVKLLDAAAAGVPIVTTALGAEGLTFRPGRDILLANTPAEFAAAVVRLRADPELVAGLVRSARTVVENNYSPRALRAAIETALEHACPSTDSELPRAGGPR
jgi:glycosyltransferase involved in cell wall biosynthesis